MANAVEGISRCVWSYKLKGIKMESIVQVAIVVLSTGAFWTYLHNKDKQRQEAHDKLTELLMSEVKKLEGKVDKLLKDKEELLTMISDLKIQLHSNNIVPVVKATPAKTSRKTNK
jgi:uncharacterized protein YlxW (UPF0749 family)